MPQKGQLPVEDKVIIDRQKHGVRKHKRQLQRIDITRLSGNGSMASGFCGPIQ